MAYPGFQRGGCLRSGPVRKVGGGGGGGGGGGEPFRFRSDTFGHTENIYMYLPTCYPGILHARANERKIHAGVIGYAVRPNFRSGGPYSLREYGPPRTQLPREYGPPDRVPWLYKTN